MAMIKTSPLHLYFLIFLSISLNSRATLSENPGSDSILIALLDSEYTRFSDLVDRALLLEPLERALAHHNLTIFAPTNEAVDRYAYPKFRSFVLDPANVESLQRLVLHHVVPAKLGRGAWPGCHVGLSDDHVALSRDGSGDYAGGARVVSFGSVERDDGVIHGINGVMVPSSVEESFVSSRRTLRSAVEPEGAPEMDRRGDRISKKKTSAYLFGNLAPSSSMTGSTAQAPSTMANEADPPSTMEDAAQAPSYGTLADSPAPGPRGPLRRRLAVVDGQKKVDDLVRALTNYGGYDEIADILANLTSLSTEMAKLISEGHKLTILAPNDEAMAKVTAEQLTGEAGAVEEIAYNHVLTDYLTDSSVYNAVRRFGTVEFQSLLKGRVVARESDGSVRFGSESGSGRTQGYLMDPDIYADGRVSVQGIDGVLMGPRQQNKKETKDFSSRKENVKKTRRGKLLELTCGVLGAIGQESRFTTCKVD